MLDCVLDRPQLLAAAQRVTAAVDVAKAGRVQPVFGHLHLSVLADGEAALTGVDQGGRATAPITTAPPPVAGEVLLPADKLVAILRECRDADVRLTATESDVTLRCGSGKFVLPALDPAGYPAPAPRPDDAGGFELDPPALAAALRRAAAAANQDDAKWATSGVCFDVEGDALTLVGTDTKVLSACPLAPRPLGDIGPPRPNKYLVPARVAKAIAAAAGHLPPPAEGHPAPVVTVRLWGRGAEFGLPGLTVFTCLQEGAFPPWRKFLDGFRPSRRVEVAPGQVAGLVRQAKIMTDVDSRRVTLSLRAGRLEVEGEGKAAGSCANGCDLPGFAGEPVVEAFDPDYLLPFFAEAGTRPTVTLGFEKPGRAWTLTAGDEYTFLVVPLVG